MRTKTAARAAAAAVVLVMATSSTPAVARPASNRSPSSTASKHQHIHALPLVAPPPPPPPAFVCPVQGRVEFVDSWGFSRSGGRRHRGVDMMAASGTPIVAPVGGTVTDRDNRVGGRSFHLAGDDGVYYYGTHLSAYGATGRVEQGTVIGYVGDSGNARGAPHLHFEIHPGGEDAAAVNPYPTVATYC